MTIFTCKGGGATLNDSKPTGALVYFKQKMRPQRIVGVNGLIILLKSLSVSGARVNAKDSKWLTPLHRAVASCSEVRHQPTLHSMSHQQPLCHVPRSIPVCAGGRASVTETFCRRQRTGQTLADAAARGRGQ